MPNKRKEEKRLHTMWMYDDEWERLTRIAQELNLTVTGFVRAIANGSVTVGRQNEE